MAKAKTEATSVRLGLEAAWGTAPGVGAWVQTGVNPGGITDWYSKNTYVERDPLSPYASREKGDLVGRTVDPRLTHDLVKDWMDLHAGPVFRVVAKHAGNTGQSTYKPTAAVDGGAGADSYDVAANGALTAGLLVRVRGFANAANNGLFVVAAGSDADSINVPTGSLVAEAPAPANALLEVAGVQGAGDDYELDAAGDLICTAGDFTTMGLSVGQGIIIGDTIANTAFASIGARQGAFIKAIAAKKLTLEHRTWTPGGADDGNGKTIRVFFTRFWRNVPIAHADYREPSLHGELEELGPGTADAAIYTYAEGLAPNTFELSAPLEGKIVTTVSYVGKNIPDPVLVADRSAGAAAALAPLAIALIDTASDTKRVRLHDANGILAADINNFTLTFTNNITPLKKHGQIEAESLIYGKFDVNLAMQAYFTNWDAAKALNDNRDLAWDAFHANHQTGYWWRLPYCALRGGARSYPANSVVTIDMGIPGFRDPNTNVVASMSEFAYVP